MAGRASAPAVRADDTMHTQCPLCQTLFNVTVEHLRLAHGVVRCGHCMNTFDALDALSDGDIERPEDEQETTPVVEGHGDRQLLRTPAEHSGWMLADGDEPSVRVGGDVPPLEFVQSGPTFDTHQLAEVAGEPDGADSALAAAAAQIGEQSRLALSSLVGVVPSLGAPLDSHENIDMGRIDGEIVAKLNVDMQGLDEELPYFTDQDLHLTDDIDEENVVPSVLEEDIARLSSARRNARSRVIYATLSVLLLMGCGAQYLFFMPDDAVKRYPLSKPLVERLCVFTGCAVAVQSEPRLVQVVSRDVRVHPRYEGALQISASLVNSAHFTQPYPKVKFTLFNVNGQIIAARIFKPVEYLADASIIPAGMRPAIETQMELDVLAPDEAAVSFEFRFL
jgi:predicted Zn finger-like uncharacterized protein